MSLLKPGKKVKQSRLNEFLHANMPVESCSFRCKPQDKAFRATNLMHVVFTNSRSEKPVALPKTFISALVKFLA